MGLLYLVGPTIQEVGGEIIMGLSIIYRVAVIDGSLYSRFYGISIYLYIYRDSASVESTRGGSLTLAPII